MTKLDITISDIHRIKDLASSHFKNELFLPQSGPELQIFLIIKGLESFLSSKGFEPNFTLISKENKGGHQPDSDFC